MDAPAVFCWRVAVAGPVPFSPRSRALRRLAELHVTCLSPSRRRPLQSILARVSANRDAIIRDPGTSLDSVLDGLRQVQYKRKYYEDHQHLYTKWVPACLPAHGGCAPLLGADAMPCTMNH